MLTAELMLFYIGHAEKNVGAMLQESALLMQSANREADICALPLATNSLLGYVLRVTFDPIALRYRLLP